MKPASFFSSSTTKMRIGGELTAYPPLLGDVKTGPPPPEIISTPLVPGPAPGVNFDAGRGGEFPDQLMNRLIRAQRLWLVRRLLLLGGSAGAAAAAFALQLIRLRLDPNGAYVHAVALFVTFIILAILVRLVRIHLEGPGLAAPSWDRHAHPGSLPE